MARPKHARKDLPVHKATRIGDVATVRAHLQDKDSFSRAGWTPVYIAVVYKQIEALRALIDMGASVEKGRLGDNDKPLFLAVRTGELELLKILILEGGASVDGADRNGVTPVWSAAYWGHTGVLELLIAAGAKDDRAYTGENQFLAGTTPCEIAKRMNHRAAEALLKDAERKKRLKAVLRRENPRYLKGKSPKEWPQEGSAAIGRVAAEPDAPPVQVSHVYIERITAGLSDDRKIGEGSFGVVYRGVDATTGLRMAVKELSAETTAVTDEARAQFEREIGVLTKMRHPNIVRLLGYCNDTDDGSLYLVYQLGVNGSLELNLADDGKAVALTWPARVALLLDLARALSYLHRPEREQGPVFHRDIKAANVVLGASNRALLIDCGLSVIVDLHQATSRTALTMTRVAGTQGYSCPRYIRSGKYGDRSDVYSFGIVVMEVLTGKLVQQVDFVDMLDEIEDTPIVPDPRPGDCPPDIVKELVVLAEKCIMQKYKDRPTMPQVMHSLAVLDTAHRAARTQELQDEIKRMHEELESARAQKEDKGDLSVCMVCVDEAPVRAGIECSMADRHFLCQSCAADHVRTQAAGEDVNNKVDQDGNIHCAFCSGILPEVQLMRLLPDNHAKDYLRLRDKAREAKLVGEYELKHRREMEEMKEAMEGDNAEWHRKHIQNEIINSHCPKCHQAFVDFDACLALMCSRCKAHFCACCFEPCANTEECHKHVLHCDMNPLKGRELFLSPDQYAEVQRKYRTGRIQEYLQAMPANTKAKIIERSAQDFKDLGLVIT